jgi:alpha-mannosidase
MHCLGIRTKPSEFIFAVYDSDINTLVNVEKVKIPKALQAPEALKYVRNTILDILREYKITMAGIRVTESNSQYLNIHRIEIEGVIQEAFASSSLASYYVGQISSLASRIGIPRVDFKRYVKGEIDFDLVQDWDELDKDEREAVLTAIGACSA